MARIRSIKPEFPQSETIGRLSRDARLLFVQIWTIVDDDGRARAASRMLASLLFPYDDDAPALIEGWLTELEKEGCIRRYDVDGASYLDLPNWLKHQKIDKPSKSRLPSFDDVSEKPLEPSRTLAPDLGPVPRIIETKAGALDAKTASPAPVSPAPVSEAPSYANDLDRVWGEGKASLIAWGTPAKQAGGVIGKWLRDSGDDPPRVLDALRRAEQQRTEAPIPFITRILQTDRSRTGGNSREDRRSTSAIERRIAELDAGRFG